jgi:hypothetical protein
MVFCNLQAWKLYEEKNLKNLIDPSLHLHVDEVKQALRVINVERNTLSSSTVQFSLFVHPSSRVIGSFIL